MADPTYPTELIARAHFELKTFERVSADTGEQLLIELQAWRDRFPEYRYRMQDDTVALRHHAQD